MKKEELIEEEIQEPTKPRKNTRSRKNTKPIKDEIQENDDYPDEKRLLTLSTVILVLGIIATIFCLFTIVAPEIEGEYRSERKFSVTGFLITVSICMFSVLSYALLNVIGNISINLFKIKEKLIN